MSELKKLEATIRRGQKSFLDTARAFLEIDRKELWKPDFRSIVDYAQARFDFIPAEVSRYRNAGIVLENLSDFATLPTNEGQCRILARLEKDAQIAVWSAVVESGEKITAKLINDTTTELLGEEATSTSTTPSPEEPPRSAIQEIVQAVNFVQAARNRIDQLDEEGRTTLAAQIDIVEAELKELRILLAS